MWLAVIYSLPVPHKFDRLIAPRRCCYTTGFSAGQGVASVPNGVYQIKNPYG